jgi:hypothetical protein
VIEQPYRSDIVLTGLLFNLVFQGLALWALVVVLATVVPPFFGPGSLLQAMAAPPRRAVAALTPAIIPTWSIPALTVFWLLALRVLFYLTMASFGLLPRIAA